jgi:hypothetical protein
MGNDDLVLIVAKFQEDVKHAILLAQQGNEKARELLKHISVMIVEDLKIEPDCSAMDSVDCVTVFDLRRSLKRLGSAIKLEYARAILEQERRGVDSIKEIVDVVECLRLLSLIYKEKQNFKEARKCLCEAMEYVGEPCFPDAVKVMRAILVALKKLPVQIPALGD